MSGKTAKGLGRTDLDLCLALASAVLVIAIVVGLLR
jgi:flagellar biosynthesis protein FliQ